MSAFLMQEAQWSENKRDVSHGLSEADLSAAGLNGSEDERAQSKTCTLACLLLLLRTTEWLQCNDGHRVHNYRPGLPLIFHETPQICLYDDVILYKLKATCADIVSRRLTQDNKLEGVCSVLLLQTWARVLWAKTVSQSELSNSESKQRASSIPLKPHLCFGWENTSQWPRLYKEPKGHVTSCGIVDWTIASTRIIGFQSRKAGGWAPRSHTLRTQKRKLHQLFDILIQISKELNKSKIVPSWGHEPKSFTQFKIVIHSNSTFSLTGCTFDMTDRFHSKCRKWWMLHNQKTSVSSSSTVNLIKRRAKNKPPTNYTCPDWSTCIKTHHEARGRLRGLSFIHYVSVLHQRSRQACVCACACVCIRINLLPDLSVKRHVAAGQRRSFLLM